MCVSNVCTYMYVPIDSFWVFRVEFGGRGIFPPVVGVHSDSDCHSQYDGQEDGNGDDDADYVVLSTCTSASASGGFLGEREIGV